MDSTAHRLIQNAHDSLTAGLHDRLGRGLTIDQEDSLNHVLWTLWNLISKDPDPPACPTCCTPLIQPTTGRPKIFCSDACRQQQARVDAHLRNRPAHDPWGTGTDDGGF